jgi:hypothetical protein
MKNADAMNTESSLLSISIESLAAVCGGQDGAAPQLPADLKDCKAGIDWSPSSARYVCLDGFVPFPGN